MSEISKLQFRRFGEDGKEISLKTLLMPAIDQTAPIAFGEIQGGDEIWVTHATFSDGADLIQASRPLEFDSDHKPKSRGAGFFLFPSIAAARKAGWEI